MDYMQTLEDKVFDLAIVDPPYGIREDGHRENNRGKLAISTHYHKALWDQRAPVKEFFVELKRISKHQIIWNANHFADAELAYSSFDSAIRKFAYRWNGMLQGYHGNKKHNETRIHPTQKPIKLYEWLLTKYAKPGQRLFDSHLGSGSSAIAAYRFGVEFVGCEIDETYYQAAVQRFEQATQQLPLWPSNEIVTHEAYALDF